jgi:hypothetical protein
VIERLLDQIALDYLCGGVRAKLVDNPRRELAADAMFAGDAAVDLQDGHDLVLGIDLLPGRFK